MGIPFASGKNYTFRFFQDNEAVNMKVKTWSVEREGTMAEDGVNGEDRNRNQFITTGFAVQIEIYQEDLSVLKKFFDQQDTEDSSTVPLDTGLGCLMRPNNGTKDAFTLSEVTLGAWKLASSGFTDRAMMTLPFKARYCQPTKAA